MDIEIDEETLGIFLEEGLDILGNWERACLDLERNSSPEVVNELFRAAHNLKGSSRSVGLADFANFVHKVEDMINLLKDGKIDVSPELVSLLLKSQGILSTWLQGLPSNGHQFVPEGTGLIDEVERFIQRVESGENPEPVEPGQATELNASSSTEKTENVEEVNPEDLPEKLSELTQIEIAKENGLPVPKPAPKSADGQKTVGLKTEETLRVAVSKLDRLMQFIGEISIQQSVIWHSKQTGSLDSKTCLNAISLSNKLVKDLQNQTLSLRMQPLKTMLQRLERVCFDVAREQQKPIQVQIIGQEVELDKTIIERLVDPLIHIVRNAVDHGIEAKEGRVQNGKSETATITIGASQEASGVAIRISDDGKGLAKKRILEKAIEKKIIPPDAKLSDSEVFNLIFQPGFSTAEKITNISGRGVGMDVVRSVIDSLHGRIQIQSEEGRGSEFVITLPTSLSILDALVVGLGGVRYAVPIQNLDEIIELTGDMIARSSDKNGRNMITLRGNVFPLETLSEYLPCRKEIQEVSAQSKSLAALIVRDGGDKVAFLVDELFGQQQIVVRPLSARLKRLPGFSGGTILGDGEPGLIIDIVGVARSYLNSVRKMGASA